jgi:hypothetical protein
MLVLGAVLVVAGSLKLWDPNALSHALHRLLPGRLRRRVAVVRVVPPLLGVAEVVVGAALLLGPRLDPASATASKAAATGLYLFFSAVVAIAVRKGVSCGRFQSLSDGPAGVSELARSIALAAFALLMLIGDRVAGRADPWHTSSLPWAVVVLAVISAAAAVGTRFGPRQGPRGYADAPLRTGLWLLLGRVTSSVSRVSLSSMRQLSVAERDVAIAAARRAPSVRIFESWLGPRAAEIDWDSAVAIAAAANLGKGLRMRCITVAPPSAPTVVLAVSLSWGDPLAADGVVLAMVDGRPVTVTRQRVEHNAAADLQPTAQALG